MTNATADVYSRPGCQKCKYNINKLRKLGLEVSERDLDDFPEKIDLMTDRDWLSLPLVEVHIGDRSYSWHDIDIAALEAVERDMEAVNA